MILNYYYLVSVYSHRKYSLLIRRLRLVKNLCLRMQARQVRRFHFKTTSLTLDPNKFKIPYPSLDGYKSHGCTTQLWRWSQTAGTPLIGQPQTRGSDRRRYARNTGSAPRSGSRTSHHSLDKYYQILHALTRFSLSTNVQT
ncbi:uncharacterized protein LOC115034326 [Acyrthosiphon pisum]|uniref:Uncharacterized protein n=1 Tax=Acyrthosiphon pisum TaxID=7029 RepID=A0A8R2JTD0_ACYPI|nr:uncharacterized protein LOC115034326 [Acyrthosiphon pisum]